MHDMMKKINGGDRESIAIMLLEAPDRESEDTSESPEESAMKMAEDQYGDKDDDGDQGMDQLKESILKALGPVSMPEDLSMEVCKHIYDAVKNGDIDAGMEGQEPNPGKDYKYGMKD